MKTIWSKFIKTINLTRLTWNRRSRRICLKSTNVYGFITIDKTTKRHDDVTGTNAFFKSILSSFTISQNLSISIAFFLDTTIVSWGLAIDQKFYQNSPFFFFILILSGMILTKKYEKLWLENFFFKTLYMEIGFNHNNFQDTTTQDVNNDNIKIMCTYMYIYYKKI